MQGGLGCHPVLTSLPIRSPEMPSDVLEWLPQARLCLPFALHPPCFDQGLCLGFPAEQGLDKQALGDVAVGNLCSFPLSLSHVLGRDLEGGGERMHVSQGHCVSCHVTVLYKEEGSGHRQ